jgi:hypothetical protein
MYEIEVFNELKRNAAIARVKALELKGKYNTTYGEATRLLQQCTHQETLARQYEELAAMVNNSNTMTGASPVTKI